MALAFRPDQSHPMVDKLLQTRVARWRELNRAIDERDDMLDFAIRLFEYDRDRALVNYFHNALEQFDLVRHVASWRGGSVRRMLDFASGYGRLTRLLVHERFAEEITVSDILAGGMQFQAEQFGVRTVLSAQRPEEFKPGERYDLIFVASLFTHLPEATFTAWLRRLIELLEPEGLLAFSVHDESIAPAAVDGIHFTATSESRVLDTSDYGSTWVSEEYVRRQVAAIGGRDFTCVRLPRELSDWQDVYVVSPAPIAHAASRRMPKGFLDAVEIAEDGIRLAGWATVGDEPVSRIDVVVDAELVMRVESENFSNRDFVAERFGHEIAAKSGWHCTIPYWAIHSFRFQLMTVSAFSRDGRETILFLGPPESLHEHIDRQRRKELESDYRQQVAAVEQQRDALASEIAAIKASRFWKARERWFAIKRAIGIGEGGRER